MAKDVGQIHYAEEDRKGVFENVCDIYASQHCTIESACHAAGISVRTFRIWYAKDAGLAEIYKRAKSDADTNFFEERIRPLTQSALERLLSGETKVERKRETLAKDGIPTGHEKLIVSESKILPNAAVTIFTAKGVFPDTFVDKFDHTTKGQSINPLSLLSPEKQEEILSLLNGDT